MRLRCIRLLFFMGFILPSLAQAGFMIEVHNNTLGNLIVQLFDQEKKEWVTQYFAEEFDVIPRKYNKGNDRSTSDHFSYSNLHKIYAFNGTMYYVVFDLQRKNFFTYEHPITAFCQHAGASCQPIQLKATRFPYLHTQEANDGVVHGNGLLKLAYNPVNKFWLSATSLLLINSHQDVEYGSSVLKRKNVHSTWNKILDPYIENATYLYDIHYHNGKFMMLGEEKIQNLAGKAEMISRLYESRDALGERWEVVNLPDKALDAGVSFYTASVMKNNVVYSGVKQSYEIRHVSKVYCGGETMYLAWKNPVKHRTRSNNEWRSQEISAPKGTRFYPIAPAHASEIMLASGDKLFTVIEQEDAETGDKNHSVLWLTKHSEENGIFFKKEGVISIPHGTFIDYPQIRPYKLFSAAEDNFVLYGNDIFKIITSNKKLEHYASIRNITSRRDVIWIHEP